MGQICLFKPSIFCTNTHFCRDNASTYHSNVYCGHIIPHAIILCATISFIPANFLFFFFFCFTVSHYFSPPSHTQRLHSASTKHAFISTECRGMGRLTAINTHSHTHTAHLDPFPTTAKTHTNNLTQTRAFTLTKNFSLRQCTSHTQSHAHSVAETEVFMSGLFGAEVALFSDPDSRPRGKVGSS